MTKIQISNCTYVTRGRKVQGQMLRFTLAMRFEFPNDLWGEFAIEGNLAYYDGPRLKWTPPITRFSGVRTQQLHWINPTLYNIVLDMLTENKRIIENLRTPIEQVLRTRIPIQAYDPSFPKM